MIDTIIQGNQKAIKPTNDGWVIVKGHSKDFTRQV